MITRKNILLGGLIVGLFQGFMVQAADQATRTRSTEMPVRIPRSFFSQSLVGTLTAQAVNTNQQVNFESSIDWNEQPTTEAPPLEGAIADFRDHLGCAYYSNLSNIAVCFNIMGDVYSLGVNSKEMQLQGIENLMNNELIEKLNLGDCSYEVQNVQFVQATRGDNHFMMTFSADAVPEANCKGGSQPLVMTFKMQEM